MPAFLLVTGLVLAFVLGAALAMRPSPRQRQLARLRACAIGEGLRIRLRPGEPVVDYMLPWRTVDVALAAALRVDADRDARDGWLLVSQGAPCTVALERALELFPASVQHVTAHAEGLAARWEERGAEEDVLALARALRALREACGSRA